MSEIADILICKSCNRPFIVTAENKTRQHSYCRICTKKYWDELERNKKETDDIKWQQQKRADQEKFEKNLSTLPLIKIDKICPTDKTLYIIGNGFDLMHGVKSSYYNFRDNLGKHSDLRDILEITLTPEDIWADFENALGHLNLDLMGSRHIVEMLLDNFYLSEADPGAAEFYMAVEAAANPIVNIVNDLPKCFRKWVDALSVGTDDRPLKDYIKPGSKVLNFNYTEFVETLYGPLDVCYIHGSRKEKKKLTLGHRPGMEGSIHEEERQPRTYRQALVDIAQEDVLDLVGQYDQELTKDCIGIINSHKGFFEGLKCTDRIITIGHSLSRVDWDYFAEIAKQCDADWYFGVHGLHDIENVKSLACSLGLKRYHIFRTDEIRTNPNTSIIENKVKPRSPRVFTDNSRAIINDGWLLKMDEYEIVLPDNIRKVIFLNHHVLIVLNDLDKSILLFNNKNGVWTFTDQLEPIKNQGLLNRRLCNVYWNEDVLRFIYNNRVRSYDLNTGKMIENKQERNARGKIYPGEEIKKKLMKV